MRGGGSTPSPSHSVTHGGLPPPLTPARIQSGWYFVERGNRSEANLSFESMRNSGAGLAKCETTAVTRPTRDFDRSRPRMTSSHPPPVSCQSFTPSPCTRLESAVQALRLHGGLLSPRKTHPQMTLRDAGEEGFERRMRDGDRSILKFQQAIIYWYLT